jgi:hypothetical protein
MAVYPTGRLAMRATQKKPLPEQTEPAKHAKHAKKTGFRVFRVFSGLSGWFGDDLASASELAGSN